MKIGQTIEEKKASLSFEFFPPRDKAGEDRLLVDIAKLQALSPTFVSVTYGAGGSTSKNTRQMVSRINKETSLTSMPHLTCVDQGKDELKAILEDYKQLGIENVLALRGDPPAGTKIFTPPKNGFCYANDLVKIIASMSAFSIGVAVYPEGHCESPNLKMDIAHTKEKVDAGADFAITQMFFDNKYFYDFIERSTQAGISIPVIPGIMPITDIMKVSSFAKKCCATIPDHISRRFENVNSNTTEARKVGIELATEQCADLLANGVPYLHFYTLNKIDIALQIACNLALSPEINSSDSDCQL